MCQRFRGGGYCNVAVITNIELPQKYTDLLESAGIQILNCPFENFNFGKGYKWGLAFYKLCALKFALENTNYDNYAIMDSDVFVQGSLSDVFKECKYGILALPLIVTHSRLAPFSKEVKEFGYFSERNSSITHYGGEFIAANKSEAIQFITESEALFNEMITKGFKTTFGDEFITSIALSKLRDKIRNAQPYIFRFWTGLYRQTTERYKTEPVAMLHVPGEKAGGMIRLFRYYAKYGRFPSRAKVHRILHLNRPSLKARIQRLIYYIQVKYMGKTDIWGEYTQ